MPIVAETLARISEQDHPHKLFVFDNESTDGTREEAEKYTKHIFSVPAGTYVPGRVLNQAMDETEGNFTVFVNSDCTPQHKEWLGNLLQGFDSEDVAAVFGRQIPHPDCWLLHAKDTEDTFGDGARQALWRHCFSMASSAVRRAVWEQMRFNEDIQYSEDIDWTWRARQAGYKIRYVADSIVTHSHNYTLPQSYRRHYGEGRAEAVIFDWQPWQKSLLRYTMLPWCRQVLSDAKYSLKHGSPGWALYSPFLRGAQVLGRRAGFLAGIKDKDS